MKINTGKNVKKYKYIWHNGQGYAVSSYNTLEEAQEALIKNYQQYKKDGVKELARGRLGYVYQVVESSALEALLRL